MGIKAFLSKPLAYFNAKSINKWSSKPIESQEQVMHMLINEASHTVFGKDHDFNNIKNYTDFKANIPVGKLCRSVLDQSAHILYEIPQIKRNY